MGKTKTSFVGGTDDQPVKPSYNKAEKEAKRKAREAVAAGQKPEKIEKPKEEKETAMEEVVTTPSKESASPQKAKPHSKKYAEVIGKINKNNEYSLSEALALVKETSYASFDGTMELHTIIRKEGFSAQVTLPHSFGKQKKIEVASEETVEKLKAGKVDFDVLLATADMMPKLVPFARLLGPKGLMPNPKNGTLIKSAKDADNFSTAAKTIKTEKSAPVIHTTFGKVSQTDKELTENIETIFKAINKKQLIRVYIKSSMSPSVKVKIAS